MVRGVSLPADFIKPKHGWPITDQERLIHMSCCTLAHTEDAIPPHTMFDVRIIRDVHVYYATVLLYCLHLSISLSLNHSQPAL